jgi:hypothetical protein
VARHRIVGTSLGLGNPSPAELSNTGKISPKFFDAAIKEFFSEFDGLDFERTADEVKVGIEPTYQGDHLVIVRLTRDKSKSSITVGYAFGHYGSGVRSKTRFYQDYKYKAKFVRFVDEWHSRLFKRK